MEKKVLIVDDDEEMCMVLKDILSYNHYSVELAHDGLQAFQKTHDEKFDLILLDVCMPVFSGFWFCDAFKNKPETQNIPVVMMSGLPKEGNANQAIQLGAAAYVKKPVDADRLLAILKEVLA